MKSTVFVALGIFCIFGLASCAPLDPESDLGNQYVLKALDNMFDYDNSTCYSNCSAARRCPNNEKAVAEATEETHIECVKCMLDCSPFTKCFLSKNATDGMPNKEELIHHGSGILSAIYLDGCRVADELEVCGRVNMSAVESHYNSTTCTEPPAPQLGAEEKEKLCRHFDCSIQQLTKSKPCQRGAMGLGFMLIMESEWLQCNGTANASTTQKSL